MVTNNHINYSNEKMVVLSLRMNKMFSSKFPRYADETCLDVSARKSIVCNYYCEIILRRL